MGSAFLFNHINYCQLTDETTLGNMTVYNLKDYSSTDAIILIGKAQYCQLSMLENGRLHYYYFSFTFPCFPLNGQELLDALYGLLY